MTKFFHQYNNPKGMSTNDLTHYKYIKLRKPTYKHDIVNKMLKDGF